MHARSYFAVLLIAVLIGAPACKPKSSTPARHFDLRGKVVAVDKDKSEVTIAHDEIQGYMAAMTMSFKVKDRWALDVMKPGDQVNATLTVADDTFLEGISVTQSTGEPLPPGVREPQPSDQVPDFKFVNQDGRQVSLHKLRGKPILLTFIYTRCPLPDYCIRMSDNFATVARELKQSNDYAKVDLLSISIDPAYDKPDVLKAYGKRYASAFDPQFSHWQFLTASPEATKKAAKWFGLTYVPEKDQIVHALRTAVLDKDGKFVKMYRGNEWKPSDAADKLKEILASSGGEHTGSHQH